MLDMNTDLWMQEHHLPPYKCVSFQMMKNFIYFLKLLFRDTANKIIIICE